jgi:hypothetical protein
MSAPQADLLNLGVAYRDLGRFDDELGCFDRPLVQFRGNNDDWNREAETLNGRAVVLRKCGRVDESLADLGFGHLAPVR